MTDNDRKVLKLSELSGDGDERGLKCRDSGAGICRWSTRGIASGADDASGSAETAGMKCRRWRDSWHRESGPKAKGHPGDKPVFAGGLARGKGHRELSCGHHDAR